MMLLILVLKDNVHWTFLPILASIVCLGDGDDADDNDAGDLDNTNLNCDVLDGLDKDNLGCGCDRQCSLGIPPSQSRDHLTWPMMQNIDDGGFKIDMKMNNTMTLFLC